MQPAPDSSPVSPAPPPPSDLELSPLASKHAPVLARRDLLLQELEREKRKDLRRARIAQVLQLVSAVQALNSLIVASQHFASNNSECANPLASWMIVNFCVNMLLNTLIVSASCLRMARYSRAGDWHLAAARLAKFLARDCMLLMFVWIIPGAVWVWGPDGDRCDGSMRKSVQVSVCIQLWVMHIAVLLSPCIWAKVKQHRLKKTAEQERRRDILATAAATDAEIRTETAFATSDALGDLNV